MGLLNPKDDSSIKSCSSLELYFSTLVFFLYRINNKYKANMRYTHNVV